MYEVLPFASISFLEMSINISHGSQKRSNRQKWGKNFNLIQIVGLGFPYSPPVLPKHESFTIIKNRKARKALEKRFTAVSYLFNLYFSSKLS